MIPEELTIVEVEELLETVAAQEAIIKAAEDKRNALVEHYNNKIMAANELCERDCEQARTEIAMLTETLRRYAEANVTEKKRSLAFPSGKLSFRKQQPRFFFEDMKEANSTNEQLIGFVKQNAPDYLKVKTEETVDWVALKPKLEIDGNEVYFAETGELISGLHVQILPDKFKVQTS